METPGVSIHRLRDNVCDLQNTNLTCSLVWGTMLGVNNEGRTLPEREVLIKISGPIRDTNQWRKCNEELYQLYGEPETEKRVRSAGLRGAGHVARMRESDSARKSTFDLLLGERTVGRPKRRRTEAVDRELKRKDAKDWKGLAVGKR
jgi:hypothetical protein